MATPTNIEITYFPSRVTEKANDPVVARRMKAGLMHWTREGAEKSAEASDNIHQQAYKYEDRAL
ncbi:MAG TPA: hypothetical protein VNN73_13980 [Blastocatellia bacterium]|nr:hypothetical protein [Blastocatellia bacterium]